MARSAPSSRFIRHDLPALGLPTMVACTPARIIRPRAKLSCSIATSAIRRSISAATSRRDGRRMSSSEKSISTSRCARIATTCARNSSTRCGKCAGQLRQRVGQCGIATRGDEVGDGLGLGEIDAAVEKCAAGEFAGLGQARAGVEGERHDAAHDEGAAVALDFGDVLAGQARRMRHRDRERTIDVRAGRGVDDVAETHRARARSAGCAGRKMASRISKARGPERRTIATAPMPGAVAGATIVSVGYMRNVIVVEPAVGSTPPWAGVTPAPGVKRKRIAKCRGRHFALGLLILVVQALAWILSWTCIDRKITGQPLCHRCQRLWK